MDDSPELILTSELSKLSGARGWLRRSVRPPLWKKRKVTLWSNGQVSYVGGKAGHLTYCLLVPGGLRKAGYEEQLRYGQDSMLVMTVVDLEYEMKCDGERKVMYFEAHEDTVNRWVRQGLEVSYQRMGINDSHVLGRCFVKGWGHAKRIKLKNIDLIGKGMNFKLEMEDLKRVYKEEYGKEIGKFLDVEDFVKIAPRLAMNSSLQGLVERYGGEGKGQDKLVLSGHDIALLTGLSSGEVEDMFERWGISECDEERFLYLLYNPDNSIIDPEKTAEPHDMTKPLNRYLISSSHNTYLVGDQLKSDSTAEMYRIVLERGCRCVEIDAWDGDEGLPVVYHGHTMTSQEPLEKILYAIREHAFSHGYEYPLIISLENHMCIEQQQLAACMFTEILGEYLYIPNEEQKHADALPSPDQLKHHILLKAKTGKAIFRESYMQRASLTGECSDDMEDDDSDDPSDYQPSSSSSRAGKTVRITSPNKKKSKAKLKIAPEFARLVSMAGGNRKALMELWKVGKSGADVYMASSCVSLSEKKMTEIAERKLMDQVCAYNTHGFTRVYPKGTRVNSSNYCPLYPHFLGCQLVALNWQANDYAMAINHARFLSNRGCGYILSSSICEMDTPSVLMMSILAGFLLPKTEGTLNKTERADPYVTVKLYDSDFVDDDESCTHKFSTDTIKSNGFSPAWKNAFKMTVRNPSLAILNVKVYDRDRASDDDVLAHASVPICALRTGIRSLPLNDKYERPLTIPGASHGASLLVETMWKTVS